MESQVILHKLKKKGTVSLALTHSTDTLSLTQTVGRREKDRADTVPRLS